jgi:parallel beta-helix repeat protein
VLVEGNTFGENKRNGLSADLGTGIGNIISFARITDNSMSGNGRDGIRILPGVDGSGATSISENDAHGNKRDGISIEATGYFLSQNSANQNKDAGISAVGNSHDFTNTAKNNQTCNTPGCFGP